MRFSVITQAIILSSFASTPVIASIANTPNTNAISDNTKIAPRGFQPLNSLKDDETKSQIASRHVSRGFQPLNSLKDNDKTKPQPAAARRQVAFGEAGNAASSYAQQQQQQRRRSKLHSRPRKRRPQTQTGNGGQSEVPPTDRKERRVRSFVWWE